MGIQNGPEYLDPEEPVIGKRFVAFAVAVAVSAILAGHALAAPRVTEDPNPINTVTGINDGPEPAKDQRVNHAPMLDAQKRLGVYVISIPGDQNEPNRDCKSSMGETQLCAAKCAAEGGIGRFPQPIWVVSGPGSLGLNLQVRSCEVHTVGGRGVMFCECFSMGQYTSIEAVCEEPAS